MKTGLLIQARTNSTRLHAKVFELINGKNFMEHILEACSKVTALKNANQYQSAIICPENDERILEWCKEKDIPVYGGSENDLVNRYLGAIKHFNLDAAMRLTGDCPLISSDVLNEACKAVSESDYASNTMVRSYPEGQDCQIGTLRAWEWLDKNQENRREHPWVEFDNNQMLRDKFYRDGLTYRHLLNSANMIFQKNSIDTQEDLDRAREKVK